MKPINLKIEKKLENGLGRAGVINTPHGEIHTPAFVVVGTKATVKALSPEQVGDLGTEVTLANTYHLYLQPGDELVAKAGGLHKFMNWKGPMITDSGGFQAFSLGAAFGKKISKLTHQNFAEQNLGGQASEVIGDSLADDSATPLAKITEDGVVFKSHIDGSEHFFTPEKSMEIQHNLGADIIFAFDECTSPTANYDYQKEAIERTHRWAKRSLEAHLANKEASDKQGLFGIVQGGRFEDLRRQSAQIIGAMDFAGFGIGGSFDKEDIDKAVGLVCSILPEEKPRHLLGIGEIEDLFAGIENGIDTFDCVLPTRMARNGTVQTKRGKLNLFNAQFKEDFSPLEEDCSCYTCRHYTRAYLAHLFRAKEMMAATLASIHNLYFFVNLVGEIRKSILEGNFEKFKKETLSSLTKQGKSS